MKTQIRQLLLCTVLFALATLQSSAGDYTPGSGWQTFNFYTWTSQDFDRPFTFQIAPGQRALLHVTDFEYAAESFTIYSYGLYGWQTPAVSANMNRHTFNIDEAFNDPAWSSATFELLPDYYSLTFRLNQWSTDYLDGMGAFKVDIIPEPTTPVLLLVASLAGLRSRKR
ncbi:MAG TPA: PEP-CTERM sorting domain-containing protein [Candidatus Paceibacterota bacterium]|nr:PEP-CTERM sorting domain-containing protein [Verrucomicrobiota bacterium]HSA09084.1 PEP-CTERM sorting domain-containing protein [Candidatus Paceibacterota bacterium]